MHMQNVAPLGSVLATGEGVYRLTSERKPAALTFNPDLPTKFAYAELKRGPNVDKYLIWSVNTTIFIYSTTSEERDPLRRIDMRLVAPSGTTTGYVTALSFSSEADDTYDILIGFSTGDVKALSLASQLSGGAVNNKPISPISFTRETSSLEQQQSRCTAVAWVNGSLGTLCISGYANGCVLLHEKVVGSISDAGLLALPSSKEKNTRQIPTKLRGPGNSGVTALAVSPGGDLLAVACRDGVLRLLDLPSGMVVGGFRSYYGGFLCCAWSPDGQVLAAGGEDDLVTLWSLLDGEIFAHGQGHASWVSAVAFDSWAPEDAGTCYRLASVGQDCQLLLWDHARLGDGGGLLRIGPTGKRNGAVLDGHIPASVPKAEMNIIAPSLQEKVHYEPLSDVGFTPDSVIAVGYDGTVKKWKRPDVDEAMAEPDDPRWMD